MRPTTIAVILLAACAPLTACKKTLTEQEVRAFVDMADDTARKRYGPNICELRGEKFTLRRKFQAADPEEGPTELEIDRRLFCLEAGKFARLRQYELERKSIDIELAADRKTAIVDSEYVEKMPYYAPWRPPASPFDYEEVQIVTSHDRSVVGIEGGDLVFLSTEADSVQELVHKKSIPELKAD